MKNDDPVLVGHVHTSHHHVFLLPFSTAPPGVRASHSTQHQPQAIPRQILGCRILTLLVSTLPPVHPACLYSGTTAGWVRSLWGPCSVLGAVGTYPTWQTFLPCTKAPTLTLSHLRIYHYPQVPSQSSRSLRPSPIVRKGHFLARKI